MTCCELYHFRKKYAVIYFLSMELAIRIQNVSKWFSQKRPLFAPWKKKPKIHALKQVNLEIPKGTLFAIVGPNGAGKTTLFRIISTLLLPDEGEVWVNGYHHGKDPEKIRRILSFTTSQEGSFYVRLTARQNLEFFSALYGFSPKETREKIEVLARTFKLDAVLDRPCEQLSSGTRQRLALARSYLHEAEIILADEPTRSLDPLSKKDLRTRLKQLCLEHGKTVLFTTHDLREAEEIADQVAILQNGRLHTTIRLADLQAARDQNSLEEIFVNLCQEESSYSDVP